MIRAIKTLLLSLIFVVASSCTLDPKYQTPKNHLGIDEKNNATISSIRWNEYFASKDLQKAIELALENNRDLKIANLNIEAARANYKVARSDLLPKLNAEASLNRQVVPFGLNKLYQAGLTIPAFELDFVGRLRSVKRSAWEKYLSTAEARNITRLSIITETANAYVTLVIDKEIAELNDIMVSFYDEKYKIIQDRQKKGIDSNIDVLNAKSNLENAKSLRDDYIKTVVEDKSNLALLTGFFDKKTFTPEISSNKEIDINSFYLNDTPSAALLSRPDIRKAEHDLKSANADIGAARAAFFPSISITGSAGYASTGVNDLFSSSSKTWSYSPQINIPIFSGGKASANLELSKVRKKIEIVNYEKAIETAFKEAIDELAAKRAIAKKLESNTQILLSKNDLSTISAIKYLIGSENKLKVIDDKIEYLKSKQQYLEIKKEYYSNLISLYKVLGGGSNLE